MGHPIILGAIVRTWDWDRVGVVAEVRGGAFRVDVHRMPSYWLPVSCVRWGDPKMVRVQYSSDEVADQRIAPPAPALGSILDPARPV